MKIFRVVISLWLYAELLCAQPGPAETVDAARITDEIITFRDEDISYEDSFENLIQILSSPVDLNTAAPEELRSLHILSDTEIETLLAYRAAQGALIDIHELQAVPGFEPVLISRLLPFVSVIDPSQRLNKSLFNRIFSPGNSYLVLRWERALTEPDSHSESNAFSGSPDKTYVRFRSAVSGDFSVGFTGEKDAGERMIFDPPNHHWGFDHTSYHLQVRNKGRLKNVIAGDFQGQFGQGLALGGAFGIGKGGSIVSTTRKSNRGFLPYTSIGESAYQRGLAITFSPVSTINISAFYSSVLRDASIEEGNGSRIVTALQTTGYHRTASELGARKTVRERNSGMVVEYKKGRMEAGIIINRLAFSSPVQRRPQVYNQFVFRGSRNLNTGAFLNFSVENISVFSEFAKSLHGGFGFVTGLLLSPQKNLDMAILYRNYQRNFYTFYSNAFSENTQPQNESGVFWSWMYRWNRRYSIHGCVDLFTFPWLGFRRYAPGNGYDWMLRCNYDPAKNVSVFVMGRQENKPRNATYPAELYEVVNCVRRSVSLNFDCGVSNDIRFRTRVQYNAQEFADKTTEGWVIAQDLSVTRGKFKFSARHSLFDADHYDNRQYIYESDAWSAYSLPAYTGIGVRNYALIEYKLNKTLTIWLRYARTRAISPGEMDFEGDVIEGNTRNDVKFQARFKF